MHTIEKTLRHLLNNFMKKQTGVPVSIGLDTNLDEVTIDLYNDNVGLIILAGATASGKSIFHLNLYNQLESLKSDVNIQCIFIDTQLIEFADWHHHKQLLPTINKIEEAIKYLESVDVTDKDIKELLVIHIEECDLFMYPAEMKKALQRLLTANNRNKNRKICIVYSTSRVYSPTTTPDWLLESASLRLAFKFANSRDIYPFLEEKISSTPMMTGERIAKSNQGLRYFQPFTTDEVEKLNSWAEEVSTRKDI